MEPRMPSEIEKTEIEKTFYFIVVSETLSKLVKEYKKLAIADDSAVTTKVGTFFQSIGFKDVGRDPQFSDLKMSLYDQFVTGSEVTALSRMDGGEKVVGLADYVCDPKNDAVNMEQFNQGIEWLADAISDAVGRHHKKNNGRSDEMMSKARQKINDTFKFCDEMGLLNKVYSETDALQRFAYVTLSYVTARSDSHESLAKGKCKLLKREYDALSKMIGELKENPAPGVYEQTVLNAISSVNRGNKDACEEASVGFDIPVSIMFAFIAKLPFKVTPREGKLGEFFHTLEASVVAQRDQKIKEAEEAKHEVVEQSPSF